MKKKFTLLILSIVLLMPCLPTLAQTKAVDIEVALGEAAVYTLYQDGRIQTAGNAIHLGNPTLLHAIDFTLTRSMNGYYVLDADGAVIAFGDAKHFGDARGSSGEHVDLELTLSQKGYYVLKTDGTVLTFGDAVFYGEHVRSTPAVDLEISSSGMGYYILYEDGVVEAFGEAVHYGHEQSTRNQAVDLERSDQGYYVAYEDGALRTFGNALPLPSNQIIGEGVVDIALTSRGFRSLLSNGEIKSYMNLETTGQIGWFAQMKPIAPAQTTPTPTPTLPPDTPFLTNLPNGFSERVIASLPEGKFMPNTILNGQLSLHNGKTFIITSDDPEVIHGNEVRIYEPQLFSDLDYIGEVFFTVNADRDASIHGLSFSDAGMIVSLSENDQSRLILIEGDFEVTEISGFLNYQ